MEFQRLGTAQEEMTALTKPRGGTEIGTLVSRVLGHVDLQTGKTEPGPGQEGSQIKSSPSDTAGVRHPVDLGR